MGNRGPARRLTPLVETRFGEAEPGRGARFYRWDEKGVTFRRWWFGRERFVAWGDVVAVLASGGLCWREEGQVRQGNVPQLGSSRARRWAKLEDAWETWRADQLNEHGELCGEGSSRHSSWQLGGFFVSSFLNPGIMFLALVDGVWNWSQYAPFTAAAVWTLATLASASLAFFFGVMVHRHYEALLLATRFRRWKLSPSGLTALDGAELHIPWSRVPRRWAGAFTGDPRSAQLMRVLIEHARPAVPSYTARKIALGLVGLMAGAAAIGGLEFVIVALLFASMPLMLVGITWLEKRSRDARDVRFAARLSAKWLPSRAVRHPHETRTKLVHVEGCDVLGKQVLSSFDSHRLEPQRLRVGSGGIQLRT